MSNTALFQLIQHTLQRPLTSLEKLVVEETAFGEISRPSCLLCIKAPSRFGKTSLQQAQTVSR